ncbi:hypothetical protein ACWPKS_00770 [Coraliomargarita sp. W4R72]
MKKASWLALILGFPGLVLAGIWGFAEGTLFFIVPDLILTLTALFSIKRSILQAIVVTMGALLAGLLMFAWSEHNHTAASEAVMSVPLVREKMAHTVQDSYSSYGASALLHGPLNGIPYKLYAIEAPQNTSLLTFLLMSVPARMQRFLGAILIAGLIGKWQRARFQRSPNLALSLWAGCWALIYIAFIILI